MQSRTGTGIIRKLSGEPWRYARVRFDLINPRKDADGLAPPQCQIEKANADGLLEAQLLVGGSYRVTLGKQQIHAFTVAPGSSSFNLWEAITLPPDEPSSERERRFDVVDSDLIGNSFVVIHDLNSDVADVTVRDGSGNTLLLPVSVLSFNSISISFDGLRPLIGTYRILIEV